MIPFTYYLYHKPTGKKYYGVRTANGCHPNDLWNTYFSSSVLVKELIEVYGKDSFDVEIRKIFENKRDALLWERHVLIRLQASRSDTWLNQNNGGGAGSHTDETRQKIKNNNAKYWSGKSRPDISERFKGHTVSEETRQKLREKLKGRIISDETRQKMKQRVPWNKGKTGVQVPWNKGKSAETDDRIKRFTEEAKRNKNTPEYKEKISSILKKSFSNPELRKRLSDNLAQYWGKVESPEGVIYEVIGLARFCREHKLSYEPFRSIKHIPNKTYKGWKFLHEDNNNTNN